MKFAKFDLNKVIQVQGYPQTGFIEVPDNVVCGMILENSTYVSYRAIKLDTVSGLYVQDITQTNLDINQDQINTKWDEVNIGRLSLTITTKAGNTYAVNRESINNMKSKIDVLINGATVKWVEDWGSWLVDSIELGEARDLAEKADQALIDSIFV